MSALQKFAAVPQRAIGDRDLKERDLRVLMAICRAVDAKTGLATISQGRIGVWAGCSRQKANASVKRLVECGYIEKVGLRRSRSGAGGYIRYRICYIASSTDQSAAHFDMPPPAAGPHGDDKPAVTIVDDDRVSPPSVTESKPDDTNIDVKTMSERPSTNSLADRSATDTWRTERDRIVRNFHKLTGRRRS